MGRDVVLYRLHRLRRLLAAAALPPVLAALILFDGVPGPLLALVSVAATTAHAIRFPNAWSETAALSLSLAAAWILLAATALATGTIGFVLALPVVAVAVLVLFFQLAVRIPFWTMAGASAPLHYRAARWTRLSADEVRPSITLWPGRNDARTSAGEADETGAFDVRVAHQVPSLASGDATEEPFDVSFRARVEETGPDRHTLAVLGEGGETLSLTRHAFRPTRRGTRVVVEEEGAMMPSGMRLGFWLQDYGADHLADEVERAEGRPERANRFAGQDTLISVIAMRMMSRAGVRAGEGSAD